jgi:TetR/AcrR family tetracycline transcriptional repressor
MILAAALELASADPSDGVSINSIARHLKLTPMALYNYFRNKDELLQALSAHLLETLVVVTPPQATPADKVSAWSYAVRKHFLKHPQLIKMLQWEGGHTSVMWLNKSRILFDALRSLGLEGHQLAKAVRWIWGVVMSAILIELHDGRTPPGIADTARAKLDPVVRRDVRVVEQFLKHDRHGDAFFAFLISRLIDGIGGMTKNDADVR